MNTVAPEAAWKTYLKAALFLAPGISVWWVVQIFVFPKLHQIWVDANITEAGPVRLMGGLHFAMHKLLMVFVLVAAVVVALEFTGEVLEALSPRRRGRFDLRNERRNRLRLGNRVYSRRNRRARVSEVINVR